MQRSPRSSPLKYVVVLGVLVAGGWKMGVVAYDVIDQPQVTARRPAAAQARRREAPPLGEPMLTVERRPGATPLLLPSDAAGAVKLPHSIEDALPADGDGRRARELAESMQRLVRDLEYSPGLEEPPQQVIVRAPEPWRPDLQAEAAAAPEIDEVVPQSASRGSVVKIRGKNLHVTQVVFGHSPARIMGGTGDEVTVEVPPGAGSNVAVAVTNSDGKYALANGKFAYAN
jgi:IPT/TIG domain-containing protein